MQTKVDNLECYFPTLCDGNFGRPKKARIQRKREFGPASAYLIETFPTCRTLTPVVLFSQVISYLICVTWDQLTVVERHDHRFLLYDFFILKLNCLMSPIFHPVNGPTLCSVAGSTTIPGETGVTCNQY